MAAILRPRSSNLSFEVADLKIDKSTYNANSGVLEIEMEGTVNNGTTFTRTATMTINTNNTASIILDNGTSYTINL